MGIICEYNPFHRGHLHQLQTLRTRLGEDWGIVCLMSGNYVQRGAPAVFDKSLRARMAILGGADLVLELPLGCCLSSAEGFAAGGVRILAPFCTALVFGTEHGAASTLRSTAQALLAPEFPDALRRELSKGCSFPAARQQALENLGCDASLLRCPNDLLAVEYCKAILSQNAPLDILPIPRPGDYHSTLPNPEAPSAAAVRRAMAEGGCWEALVPAWAVEPYRFAPRHTLAAGERAILARLRTMDERDYAALPGGSEGLWRRLQKNARTYGTLEEILTRTKTKRYTRSRLDRMVLCAFLGLTEADLTAPAPDVRVLAMNRRGREILKQARTAGHFPNAGERTGSRQEALETRAGDLYGLFAQGEPEPPGAERRRRVFVLPEGA